MGKVFIAEKLPKATFLVVKHQTECHDINFIVFLCEKFAHKKIYITFAFPFATERMKLKERALSSVGSEHLVYTEGVGGSNPSAPTTRQSEMAVFFYLQDFTNRLHFVDQTEFLRRLKWGQAEFLRKS